MTLDAAENRCTVSKVIQKDKLQDAMPDCDKIEKLLRYETAVERSPEHALNRLERLQRRRLRNHWWLAGKKSAFTTISLMRVDLGPQMTKMTPSDC